MQVIKDSDKQSMGTKKSTDWIEANLNLGPIYDLPL